MGARLYYVFRGTILNLMKYIVCCPRLFPINSVQEIDISSAAAGNKQDKARIQTLIHYNASVLFGQNLRERVIDCPRFQVVTINCVLAFCLTSFPGSCLL
jgi:hypothetical protein